MKRKTKGSTTASIALFVSSGLMASFLGVRQYDRATTEMGWVTRAPMTVGQVITPQSLTQARVDIDAAAIEDPRQLLGQRLAVAKPQGASFRQTDLAPPPAQPARKTLAQHIPEGRVLYSLQLRGDSTIPFSQLHAGDRLDVLVRGRRGVRTAATDVRLIGVMRPRQAGAAGPSDQKITSLLPQRPSKTAVAGGGATLVLAVDPAHVYPLAQIGTADNVSLVLHSAHDIASGQAVSITPPNTEQAVEVVAGLKRQTIYVAR